jgi:antitoxin (DNA-binding transcriptional repressor) of toxin-antitoxin stability system
MLRRPKKERVSSFRREIKPIASIVPLDSNSTSGIRPKFGLAKGACKIPGDFDAPIESLEENYSGV